MKIVIGVIALVMSGMTHAEARPSYHWEAKTVAQAAACNKYGMLSDTQTIHIATQTRTSASAHNPFSENSFNTLVDAYSQEIAKTIALDGEASIIPDCVNLIAAIYQ